jgi:thiamine-phosphate pyrophosphorylase
MPKILSSKVKKNIPCEFVNDSRIYRLLDANFNRAREGLRIVEDVFRFVLPKYKIAIELKKIRLELNEIVRKMYPQLIQARDINSDFGARTKEKKRKNIKNLVMANFSRSEEALRVLEEFGKIVSASLGEKFKKLRFRVYALEKDIFLALKERDDYSD